MAISLRLQGKLPLKFLKLNGQILLKSYTRNTMGHGLLSLLAMLAIEKTKVKSLENTFSWYYRVTEYFLEKEQRAEFM